MELIINIPEDVYNKLVEIYKSRKELHTRENLYQAIAKGKPYEAEINKIKSAISEVDFDFGDYYDHTGEIIDKILSKIDEVMKNETAC